MNKLAITTTLLIFAAVLSAPFAQDGGVPKIAVYITGGNSAEEDKILSQRLLSTLVDGGLFRPVERGDDFLKQIAKEMGKQRDGSVDNAQVKRIGRQFGVQYLCIGDLASAFGITQISARIVDVETAEVLSTGQSEADVERASELRGAELIRMMETVAQKMTPSILRAMERR